MAETVAEVVTDLHHKMLHDIADRVNAAVERERKIWREQLADAIEVANGFKETLTRVLDLIAYHASNKSSNPRRRGATQSGHRKSTSDLC